MKAKILSLLLFPLLVLTACNKTPAKSETTEESSESETTESSQALPEWVDYAHNGSVKLQLDYAGRDFYADGIGEVTLKSCIDGDTAHFYPVVTTTSKLAIKSRFYGIDTPESTGRIQPWGKPASNFTKEHLKAAAENGTIVVSTARSDYGLPEPDSTGERYVSLIWINETVKHASYDSLVLLNLYIVQEGYSWVKNVEAIPAYRDVFYAAESQAKAYQLHLFGNEDDPYYPKGDYQVVTILDLKRETMKTLTDPDYHSDYDYVKVCITGTVAGYSNGSLCHTATSVNPIIRYRSIIIRARTGNELFPATSSPCIQHITVFDNIPWTRQKCSGASGKSIFDPYLPTRTIVDRAYKS